MQLIYVSISPTSLTALQLCWNYYLLWPLLLPHSLSRTLSHMAGVPRASFVISSFSEQWLIMVGITILACGFLAYVIYDAVVVTAADLLHRLLMVSPVLLVLAVHWLSTVPPANRLNFPMPGSEPDAIHRAGTSPWGLAVLLLLLFLLISYQPSLHGLFFW